MDLELLQAQWKLGFIRPEEAHVIATRLLETGIEFPSIILLAGMIDASSWWEVEPVIERAFAECGLSGIDETAARWRIAYETARQIVTGEVTPLRGATTLCQLAGALDFPQPLRYFVYLASDYGEGPGDRATEEAWFDARIVENAHELLALKP